MKKLKTSLLLKLTERERIILEHVVSGKSSREIAQVLNISPRTVDIHRSNIRKKTNTSNVAELINVTLKAARNPRKLPAKTDHPAASLISEQLPLKLLVEQLPFAVAMFDMQMHYIALSKRWANDYQIGNLDVVGRSHYEIFPEIPKRWKDFHRRGLHGETLGVSEDKFVRADGSVQWLDWEIKPWYAGDQSIGGIIIYAQDVTKFVEAKNVFLQAMEQLKLGPQRC